MNRKFFSRLTAGERRKLDRNLAYNRSARQLGVALFAFMPIVAVAALLALVVISALDLQHVHQLAAQARHAGKFAPIAFLPVAGLVKNYDPVIKRIQPLNQNAPVFYELIPGVPGQILLGIDLILRGNLVLSAGSASGTSQGENPGGLINNFQIDATASPFGIYRGGKIKNLTSRSILRHQIWDKGRFQDDLGGSGLITGAATTFALNLRLPLRFAQPYLLRPMETALRLDQFSQVLLTINMASVASQLSGNDRTVDMSGLFFDVIEHRVQTIDASKPTGYWPAATLFDDDRLIPITAANSRFVIDTQLPKSESYLDLQVATQSTNVGLVDTILNRATVFQGSEMKTDIFERELRMQNNDERTEAATALTGLYYLNFAQGNSGCTGMDRSGLLSNAVPFPSLIVDIANPGGAADSMLIRRHGIAPRLADPPQS